MLPRHIIVRYAKPLGDNSGLIEDFDVTSEEQIDLLVAQLNYERLECEPVFVDSVVVGVKHEDDCICVRFKTKGKLDSFTFCLDHEGILLLKDFLERIAISDQGVVVWESKTSEWQVDCRWVVHVRDNHPRFWFISCKSSPCSIFCAKVAPNIAIILKLIRVEYELSAFLAFKYDGGKFWIFFQREMLGKFTLVHFLGVVNVPWGAILIFCHSNLLDEGFGIFCSPKMCHVDGSDVLFLPEELCNKVVPHIVSQLSVAKVWACFDNSCQLLIICRKISQKYMLGSWHIVFPISHS